jgi:hypothetical protein
MSRYDISRSGNGFDSDGLPLDLFQTSELDQVKEQVYDTFIMLAENFQADRTEPNPFLMTAATFSNDYYFGSHYKNEVEEFFEEIQGDFVKTKKGWNDGTLR